MQRKQQLAQQDLSPRNTNKQEMTSSQKGIPTTSYSEENVSFQVTTKKESTYFEITNQSNFDDVTSRESSLPSQVMNTDEDFDKRGSAYKMPSKIKEKKFNAPSFQNSNTQNLYRQNEVKQQNHSSMLSERGLPPTMNANRIGLSASNNKNNGGSNNNIDRAYAMAASEDHSKSQQPVQNRMKAFNNNVNNESSTSTGRPNSGKSTPAAIIKKAVPGDYRYHGNDYDSTQLHSNSSATTPRQVIGHQYGRGNSGNNNSAMRASNPKLILVPQPPAAITIEYNGQILSSPTKSHTIAESLSMTNEHYQENSSTSFGFDSSQFGQNNANITNNTIIRKNVNIKNKSTTLPTVEYKKCVKDSRILREIEEQENRENEVVLQRRIINDQQPLSYYMSSTPSPSTHNLPPAEGGNDGRLSSLQYFLMENEITK